jgi:small GTP-binding protein|tara:strand:- start:477 stop:1040 length:564 start_codon:yes stop_codon:yes gene_type:complete
MRYNVVFVGSVGAGKTSLIQKYHTGTPPTTTKSTIAVDFIPMTLGDYDISLWDTCGQERFLSLSSSYFSRGHVFILVHDISKNDFDTDLQKWHQRILDKKAARHTPVVIVVSNKTDLEPFCPNEMKHWIEKNQFDHIYTSVVNGEGTEELFHQIATAIKVHQFDWDAPSLPTLLATDQLRTAPGCAC